MASEQAAPLLPADAGREDVCAFFDLSEEACQRLGLYVDELRRWNATINLVARSTLPRVWVRHVADGLQLLRHLPEDARQVIDLGSGSGVPGLVMALAGPGPEPKSGQMYFTLVESNHRKAAFLRQVAQRAGIDVNMMQQRIETLDASVLEVDAGTVVVARALAPLPKLLCMAAALFEQGATALLPKGREAAAELEMAQQDGWQFDSQAFHSVTDAEGVILQLREVRRV